MHDHLPGRLSPPPPSTGQRVGETVRHRFSLPLWIDRRSWGNPVEIRVCRGPLASILGAVGTDSSAVSSLAMNLWSEIRDRTGSSNLSEVLPSCRGPARVCPHLSKMDGPRLVLFAGSLAESICRGRISGSQDYSLTLNPDG